MKRTRVVNIYHDVPYQVNIMRPSKWGNPFCIGRNGDREEVLVRYMRYLKGRPDLLASIHKLRGKVLGCCCKPAGGFGYRLMCHGQVLAGIADEIPAIEVQ